MKRNTATQTPGVPFHVYLTRAMDNAGLQNVDVAQALGYPRPNVIAMFRNGTMRVPIAKLGTLARLLEIDAASLLQQALSEYDPALLETLRELMGQQMVTRNELAIIEVARDAMAGSDVNLTDSDDFVMSLKGLVGKYTELANKGELATSSKPIGRAGSKATRMNTEMQKLLVRQAEERKKLYEKVIREMGGDMAEAA